MCQLDKCHTGLDKPGLVCHTTSMKEKTTMTNAYDRIHEIASVNGAWADWSNETAVLIGLDLEVDLWEGDIIIDGLMEDLGKTLDEVSEEILDGYGAIYDSCRSMVATSPPSWVLGIITGYGFAEDDLAEAVYEALNETNLLNTLPEWVEAAEEADLEEFVVTLEKLALAPLT